jgi:hypothetical protein
MRQHAFTIVTEVRPDAVHELGTFLDSIGDHVDDNGYIRFGDLTQLHFASWVLVDDAAARTSLYFEGNVDGPVDEFLYELLALAAPAVDQIYGSCVGYPAGGAAQPQAVVAWMRSQDIGADTFYVAWPGHSVQRICQEQELRQSIGEFLDRQVEAGAVEGRSAQEIRSDIQEFVRAQPGLQWALSTPPDPFEVRHGKVLFRLAIAAAVAALAALVVVAMGGRRGTLARALARRLLAGIPASLAAAVVWLRVDEVAGARADARRRPDWETTYTQWLSRLPDLTQREDFQVQNHFASVTEVKAGPFRRALLRLVLWVVNADARILANKGNLGGISSIHFARWVLAPGGRRLVFLTNYDGSWESYLNDFIDLASKGLTAVWSNSTNAVGFPRTRFLVLDGARDEQRFKAYARYSQVRTRAWYSAYPDLTVRNIGNNLSIRDQLFGPLDDKEAQAWLLRF